MDSRLFSSLHPRSTPHLQSWDTYREMELTANKQHAVTETGDLLEYETLVSRLLPPNIRIDNDQYEDKTVLIIDSANRPGTLVEVVQCLTELGLSVRQARISSDGGWFVDEFQVTETPCGRVTDAKKLNAIKTMLSLSEQTGEPVPVHTVFQIAGPETPGLLADITELLSHNGLQIRTAAAWTFHGRAAIVLGVTEHNAPVHDAVKLHRLQQLLTKLVEKTGDAAVAVEQVEGDVHHERRLHQLLLADEIQAWKQLKRLQHQHSLPFPGPINTQAAAADADGDLDDQNSITMLHTPKTPRQQWQRKMLPPSWTVDQRGKPVYKDLIFEQAMQQQQQQRRLDAAAVWTGSAQAVASSSNEAASQLYAPLHSTSTSSSSTQPVPSAAAVTHDGGVAAYDSAAAAAAAAAQQTSVDKLIALLQPQPLARASSSPPTQQTFLQSLASAPIARVQDAATAAAAAAGDQGEAAGRDISSREAGTDQQQQQRQLTGSVLKPAADASAAGTQTAAAAAAPHGSGLPPRAPGTQISSSSSSHAAPASAPQQQQQQQLQQQHSLGPFAAVAGAAGSTVPEATSITSNTTGSTSSSATTSPVSSVDSKPNIPSATKSGLAGSSTPLSPGRLASAAAAAGQLSPRALRIGVKSAASLPTGSASGGSMFGLQQQQPYGLDAPDFGVNVQIQHSSLFNYWLVTIRCRDRNKLFFDTVCTLCDMRYDIFHATIDGEPSGWATQLFYIRPRFGSCVWDERRASVLQAMLTSAVQRRFPPGLRVHVFTGSAVCLQDLVRAMKRHRLTITRCKVRAYDTASHTFSLLNQDGSLPSRQQVQMACQSAGGELVDAPLDVSHPCVATVLRSLDARGRFAFSFVTVRSHKSMPAAAAADCHRMIYPAGEVSAAIQIGDGHHTGLGVAMLGEHGVRGQRGALAMIRPGQSSHDSGQHTAASSRDAARQGPGSVSSEQQPSF